MVTERDQAYRGDHFVMCMRSESLCHTPESIMIVYLNYTSIKRKKIRNLKKKIAQPQEKSYENMIRKLRDQNSLSGLFFD